VPRTGDEPAHARSALGLRLGLTLAGTALWAGAAVLMFSAGMTVVGLAFVAVAVLSALNAAFVVHRMRQGAHFQPTPDTPPYRPVADDPPERVRPPRPPVDERTRATRYLVLMGICLGLLVLAWGVVRLWSVPLAVGMSVVAMVLPPVAAVVANHGWDRR
jgi:Flp pilus assembly protein TadB